MAVIRDKKGRFSSKKTKKGTQIKSKGIMEEHNYISGHICNETDCKFADCPLNNNIKLIKSVNRNGWKIGRRIVEFGILLSGLSSCKVCRLGPIPLTVYSVVGELRKGLGGYLYVKCQNVDCNEVNIVPYGKTHHLKKKGSPCFAVNTKLGIGK